MRIVFPCLHPALCPDAPADAVFLDPGLALPKMADPEMAAPGMAVPEMATSGQPKVVTLETLPLNRQEARACLAEMLAFGEQFQKPGDMAYFSVAGMENFYSGTAMDYREELEALTKADQGPEKALAEKRLAAQRLLLLAWRLEESRLEVQDVSDTLESLKDRFASSVTSEVDGDARDGDVDDPEMARLVGQLVPDDLDLDPAAGSLEWRRLVEAVLLLAPEEAALVICDQDIARELGLDDVTAIPGWKLAGLETADAERPWLDREVACHPMAATDGGAA